MFSARILRSIALFTLFTTSMPAFAVDCNDILHSRLPASASAYHLKHPSHEFRELERTLDLLITDGAPHEGTGLRVVMAAIELGKVKGLKTVSGKPLNIAAGGVSAVMNDIAHYYPKMLAKQKNSQLTVVGVLMDDISTKGMNHARTIEVQVDQDRWKVEVFEYTNGDGLKYVFLDNPSFKRFTATPNTVDTVDQSVYTMRGLEAGARWDKLEEQKIWSAINQSVAEVVIDEKAHIYVPHDHHVSPASFYVYQNAKKRPLSLKPLVHNEGYLGNYWTPDDQVDEVRRIWNIGYDQLREYFMQGDQLMMMAPAVRLAEQTEIFSAFSVSEGTAQNINGVGTRKRIHTDIDFFDRVGELTNGLGEENKPHLTQLLKKGSPAELAADKITHPEVVEQFSKEEGYQLAEKATPKQVAQWQALSKRALQLNFGMTVDPKKPLFVGFSRLVKQKGMKFVAENIEHILERGGQVMVGGPVQDSVGESERRMFLKIKRKLEGTPFEKDFVFIDGAVLGRVKGLILAGGDFFLIPSRFEPCGLTDCEALYYGTIPIAHDTGGLNKGKETILYTPASPDEQGWQLGEAINRAFDLYADPVAFRKKQVRAMKQNFSVEQNFSSFLRNYRVEAYGKMMKELDRLVSISVLTHEQAQGVLSKKLKKAPMGDIAALVAGLKMIHPSRRTSLMSWFIEQKR